MVNPTAVTQGHPRRRFAPVPIETTFAQYRKTGPAPEPTPSPSPRSESPPVEDDYVEPHMRREKRRFAPQLVESSVRRSRRAGDEGPATKPTDKTDITPYTNHIYAPKARRRHGRSRLDEERRAALARRESQDDEVAGGVFERSAKEAQRKVREEKFQELALSAFPNSGIRIGGAEHYVMREGSESDSIPSRGRTTVRFQGPYRPSRRNSSEEDISWAFKEMQEHAARVERQRSHAMERISTLDLDNMSIDSPPSDAMGLTRNQRQSMSGSPSWSRRRSTSLDVIGEHHMPYIPPESPLPTIGENHMPYVPPESPPIRPIGESFMPYIPSAPPGKAGQMAYVPASHLPPDTDFHSNGHTPVPYGSYGPERDPSLERLRNLHHVNRRNSPPMLGSDLVFRRCPSPKHTKLEPDHLWDLEKGTTAEEPNRDKTGQEGLWRGYCYSADKTQQLAGFERPQMIQTPQPLLTPGDPFARAFSMSEVNAALDDSAEPTSRVQLHTHSAYSTIFLEQKRRHEKKGIHMLQGLDERLAKEKAAAELDERIQAEFDDHFVTQVYNYLSLGYPAMARAYDEELSKISKMPVEELEKDDDIIMDSLWGINSNETDSDSDKPEPTKKVKATGHIMLDSEEHDGVREEDRCPRWKALKKYIYEWARQHPDLDAISPLAWGMQERRGSWGI